MTYLLCLLALVKLDERVLQRISGLLVADHLTTHDCPEAGEYELEVFVASDGVQLAHEQDVLWRPDVREGEVADHLERERGCLSCFLSPALLFFLFG